MVAALPCAERRKYGSEFGDEELYASYARAYGIPFDSNPTSYDLALNPGDLHTRYNTYRATEYVHELQLVQRSGTLDVVEELLLERRKEANDRTKNLHG